MLLRTHKHTRFPQPFDEYTRNTIYLFSLLSLWASERVRTHRHSKRTISNCYESAALSQQQVDRFGIFGSSTTTTTATKMNQIFTQFRSSSSSIAQFTASLVVCTCMCVVVDVWRINRTKILAQIYRMSEKCSRITCVLCENRISSIQSLFMWVVSECMWCFLCSVVVDDFELFESFNSFSPSVSNELTFNIYNFISFTIQSKLILNRGLCLQWIFITFARNKKITNGKFSFSSLCRTHHK